MWNYPFDPNEIEGDNDRSTVGESLWLIATAIITILAVTYFGGHLLAFLVISQ